MKWNEIGKIPMNITIQKREAKTISLTFVSQTEALKR